MRIAAERSMSPLPRASEIAKVASVFGQPDSLSEDCRFLYLAGGLYTGGSERQLYYLLRTLDRERYKPAVVTWNYCAEDVYVRPIRELGVPIYHFADGAGGMSKLSAFRRLVRMLEPEVVHSYSFYTNIAAAWGVIRTRAIAVGSVRSDFTWAKKESGVVLGRLSARWPTHQICNSLSAAAAVRESRSVFAPRHCDVVCNGLDLERFHPYEMPRRGRPRILGLGYLLPVKRWDRLLRAAARLKRAGVDFEMWIVGDGPLRAALEDEARRLAVDDRVQLLPHTDDVPHLIAECSIVAHVADYEGRPNAVMEAMACGCAVVATAVGDIPHLVDDGRTGFLVGSDDESLLAERMLTLILNPQLCRRMGVEGRSKAKVMFGLDYLVRETLASYRTAGWTECTPHVSSVHGSGT
jgi:glycosyltransferase involved in cell wall biosynthesis